MAAESHGEKKDYLAFFTLQMGWILGLANLINLFFVDSSWCESTFILFLFFLFAPSWSESIRVDPTRTDGLSWSGPTFVPA